MKTAISIPDQLFDAAEAYAHVKGLSRSELFARALDLYLQMHGDQEITARLNAVYGEESSEIEAPLKIAQARVLQQDPW